MPKRRHHPDVKAYVETTDQPIQSIVQDLRRSIKAASPDIKETILWTVPFFFVEQEAICYLSAAKKHVTLGFPRGAEFLGRSEGFTGTGKTGIMKRLIKPDAVPDADEVGRWVHGAIALPPDDEC